MEIDSLFGEPDSGQPYAAGPARPDHRPRQAAYVVTIMVLALGAAGLSVALQQTRQSQEAWEAAAERRAGELASLESQRDDLQRQLLDARTAVTSAEESLAATTAQLQEATGQIQALTEQKAAMLDKATFMPSAISMATELARSVTACALVLEGGAPPDAGAAATSDGADPAALVASAAPAAPAPPAEPGVEGDRPCDRARADSEAFTKWLGSQ